MDEKEQRILQQLSTGKTREELAAEEGNTHWKSIDMYMRRRDYVWCSERHNYIKTDEQSIPEVIAKASDDGLLRKPIELFKHLHEKGLMYAKWRSSMSSSITKN